MTETTDRIPPPPSPPTLLDQPPPLNSIQYSLSGDSTDMGIDCDGSLFHHANVGKFSELIITLKHRAALNNRTGPPIVYFDASWLARKFAGHSMYDRISDLVYIFAMNGSSVVVVLDGPTRHHSKKARAARVMDAEQARFDSLLLQKV